MMNRTAPAAILLAIFCAATGCAARAARPVTAPDHPTPVSLQRLHENQETVVQVLHLPNGLGTGVVVREDGYVLTNEHVVRTKDPATGAETGTGIYLVCTYKDAKRDCAAVKRVVATDPKRDLALLEVDKTYPRAATLNDDPASVEPYDEVYLIGSIFELVPPSPIGGRVVNRIESWYYKGTDIGADLPLLLLDLSFSPGSSGGPTFDAEGRLIALGSRYTNIMNGGRSWAIVIPIEAIAPFVKKHLPARASAPPAKEAPKPRK